MTALVSLLIGMVFQPVVHVSADLEAAETRLAEQPIVVELFASQNCPACPRAHQTMQKISAERDDVFVLTWSVNYWDYLGEPDPLAIPEARRRQDAYADALRLRGPYTPQSIYNGVKQCSGAQRRAVNRNLASEQDRLRPAAPTAMWQNDRLTVPSGCASELEVVLVDYLEADEHDTIMVNPIISSKVLGTCAQEEAVFEASCDESCAILMQEPGQGEIVKTVFK